jgi:hypothetical protein
MFAHKAAVRLEFGQDAEHGFRRQCPLLPRPRACTGGTVFSRVFCIRSCLVIWIGAGLLARRTCSPVPQGRSPFPSRSGSRVGGTLPCWQELPRRGRRRRPMRGSWKCGPARSCGALFTGRSDNRTRRHELLRSRNGALSTSWPCMGILLLGGRTCVIRFSAVRSAPKAAVT